MGKITAVSIFALLITSGQSAPTHLLIAERYDRNIVVQDSLDAVIDLNQDFINYRDTVCRNNIAIK